VTQKGSTALVLPVLTAHAVMAYSPQTPEEQQLMTRKHFESVAKRLNEALRLSDDFARIERLAISLADDFEEFNENFNRSKFLAVALA